MYTCSGCGLEHDTFEPGVKCQVQADLSWAMATAMLAMAEVLDQGWREMMGTQADHTFEGLLSVLEQKTES